MRIQNTVCCDVLVAGGGIAGLMAAIAAADGGASVVIAEKANTLRSGAGATGNDHFVCYIPEIHGDFQEYMKELRQCQSGTWADDDLLQLFARRSFEVAQDWHRWGISMKTGTDGNWYFLGHAFPDHMRIHLKYDGRNQKRVLTAEAKKRGVRIVNRCPVTEFLTDGNGRIAGALGLDTSQKEPALTLFQAKCVIASTGATTRLYSSITPAMLFNISNCPANAGAGLAAAYRAGATLVNVEMPVYPAGPKFFARAGKGTWIGVLRNRKGENIGPFLERPSKELGDITGDVWPTVFQDKMKDGTGPTYCDCHEISQEDYEYMMWAFSCEGDTSLVDAMERQNIDLRRHMVEFGTYAGGVLDRGVQIDETCATDVPGLFAAGNQIGNLCGHIAGAAVTGRIAGEAAARCAAGRTPAGGLEDHPVVRERSAFYDSLMERPSGARWQEVNIAVNQILDDYSAVSGVRSESLLRSGLLYLDQLRGYARDQVSCASAHELMRALEAFDLMEIGGIICAASLLRQESRGPFQRSDYTFTNPMYNGKFITVRRENGVPQAAWRAAR